MQVDGAKDIGNGWMETPTGQRFYDPVSAVHTDYEKKNAAQKVESLILTAENVKKVTERVAFLEEQLAKLAEEVTRMKAGRKAVA
jgi:uncharacterized small protein (DUF1192 family)